MPLAPHRIYFTERGSGPPLLLVHGLTVTGEMFAPVMDQLAHRYRVIAPDLRGHGRSRNLGPPYTVAQLAEDLAQLLDQLGIDGTAVLGYSHGGAVAQQLALDHPERCRRLVLACTYAYNMASAREKLEGHLVPLLIRALGMRRFARLILALGLKRVRDERRNWIVGLIADQDTGLMVQAWREAMAFDSRRRLGKIACPTLIIAARDDTAVPLHHALMLRDGIRGSRLVTIEDADHALIWTRPDELALVTEEFLTGDGPSPNGQWGTAP